MSTILGLDVGGSGIKGALVNIETGELVAPRHRLPTPEAAKPAAVGEVLKQLTLHFQYSGPVGIGFPSVIRHGVILTAANVDSSWIGLPANEFFGKAIGKPDLKWLNFTDADTIGGMLQNGVPEEIAKNYTEMGAAMRSGEMAAEYNKSRAATFGKNNLETFAPVFAAAYAQS